MKMRHDVSGYGRVLAAVALLLFGFTAGLRADQAVVFGLTNQSINGATVYKDGAFTLLRVENLSDFGTRGVAVQLGQADSGLFFAPYVSAALEDGNFMTAHAYGKVGHLSRRICSVVGRRSAYATYPVAVDFAPLGSLLKTYQIWCNDKLAAEVRHTSGEVIFSTDNNGFLSPRVNPYFRATDGSAGTVIEVALSPITLPNGRQAYGNKVVVRPEHPLWTVSYVSRMDVYGGGRLPHFQALSQSVGAFSLPHLALGPAHIVAGRGTLALTELGTDGDGGVMVELNEATGNRMSLRPVALSSHSLIKASASGRTSYQDYSYGFLGPVGLRHNGETVEVFGEFGGDPSYRVQVSVYRQGERVGMSSGAGGTLGALPTNEWKVVASGVRAGSPAAAAALYFTLDRAVAFTPIGSTDALVGDELRFSWEQPGPDVGSFQNFQLQASGLPGFTLTNSVVFPRLDNALAIERAGTNVTVSWPYGSGYSYVDTANDVEGGYNYPRAEARMRRSRWEMDFPIADLPHQFFRLVDYCDILNSHLTPTGD